MLGNSGCQLSVALRSYLISRVNTNSWGVLFVLCDLFKHQESSIVLLFGLPVSETLLSFYSSAKPCYSSPHWLSPKPTVVFWKGSVHVRLGSRSHSSLLCTSACNPPLSMSFWAPLFLLFSPLGLCNQCGKMAPWQLWSYSGNLCRCGSCGGIYLSSKLALKDFYFSKTTLIPYSHAILYCTLKEFGYHFLLSILAMNQSLPDTTPL